MKIEIDPYAGFCFGVEKAIQHAEVELAKQDSLLCLGEIVHNSEEVGRLGAKGLRTLSNTEFSKLKNKTVLIRAHGEPPETYSIAKKNGLTLVEATCPIVLKLQKQVRDAWLEMKAVGGSVVIAGKKNHPEVIGLNGHAANAAIIIEKPEDLKKLNTQKPIRLFAQTTFDAERYKDLSQQIEQMIGTKNLSNEHFKRINSVCGHVTSRVPKLTKFCQHVDLVLFVSGKSSSNGKSLFEVCKAANKNSYFISTAEEIKGDWLGQSQHIGISGATSTPRWLMEAVAEKIAQM